ncbi:hypothetical protein SCOR_35900 [Sulfidibacter corallicola]
MAQVAFFEQGGVGPVRQAARLGDEVGGNVLEAVTTLGGVGALERELDGAVGDGVAVGVQQEREQAGYVADRDDEVEALALEGGVQPNGGGAGRTGLDECGGVVVGDDGGVLGGAGHVVVGGDHREVLVGFLELGEMGIAVRVGRDLKPELGDTQAVGDGRVAVVANGDLVALVAELEFDRGVGHRAAQRVEGEEVELGLAGIGGHDVEVPARHSHEEGHLPVAEDAAVDLGEGEGGAQDVEQAAGGIGGDGAAEAVVEQPGGAAVAGLVESGGENGGLAQGQRCGGQPDLEPLIERGLQATVERRGQWERDQAGLIAGHEVLDAQALGRGVAEHAGHGDGPQVGVQRFEDTALLLGGGQAVEAAKLGEAFGGEGCGGRDRPGRQEVGVEREGDGFERGGQAVERGQAVVDSGPGEAGRGLDQAQTHGFGQGPAGVGHAAEVGGGDCVQAVAKGPRGVVDGQVGRGGDQRVAAAGNGQHGEATPGQGVGDGGEGLGRRLNREVEFEALAGCEVQVGRGDRVPFEQKGRFEAQEVGGNLPARAVEGDQLEVGGSGGYSVPGEDAAAQLGEGDLVFEDRGAGGVADQEAGAVLESAGQGRRCEGCQLLFNGERETEGKQVRAGSRGGVTGGQVGEVSVVGGELLVEPGEEGRGAAVGRGLVVQREVGPGDGFEGIEQIGCV